jgi:hypothetical protein
MVQICQGFNVFLSFAVKPGLPLEQVQQGVTEVIDELGYRLGSFLNEKDLQSNADKYEVAEQTNQNHCYRFDRVFFFVFLAEHQFQEVPRWVWFHYPSRCAQKLVAFEFKILQMT